jgi:hypothetical protein
MQNKILFVVLRSCFAPVLHLFCTCFAARTLIEQKFISLIISKLRKRNDFFLVVKKTFVI